MRHVTLVAATVVIGVGLAMVLWRELSGATERRRVGAVRNTVEVMMPVLGTIALVTWAWWAS